MKIENLLPVRSRAELRGWLQEHGRTAKCCWVVVRMKPSPDTLYYLDVVEEALCFGWIDSTKKKINDTETAQRLSPRQSNSSWTELNKACVRRLEKLGLMTEEGRQVLPNMAPEAFQINKQIEQRLREDPQVYENFKNFPAPYQRVRIDTIQSVLQQPELFQRRLDKFIACTKANQMYGQWHDGGRLLEV